MTDYIKREDAAGIFVTAKEQVYTIDEVMEILASADVAPVRHGRWIGDSVGVKCSCCGMHDETESIYCPNCGARMRIRGNED